MFRKKFPPGSRSRPEPPPLGEVPKPAQPVEPPARSAEPPARPAEPPAQPVSTPSLPSNPLDIVAPARPKLGQPQTIRSPGRTLIVGRDIALSGEIATCEKLLIEGRVEGEVSDTQRLEIAETGRFKGRAEVLECVVAGACEGELNVAGLLSIRSKGRIKGTVRYAEIEIQRGGRLAGEVDNQAVREVPSPAQAEPESAEAGPEGGPRRA